jgi:membrane associated rhomboid family serine protease
METTGQMQLTFPSPAKLFRPGVTTIIVLLAAGILLSTFSRDFMMSFLAISAQNVLRGKIWQLVTYPFASDSAVNLVFSGLMVLFVGSVIEQEWRTASFLLLWLVTSVGCGLLWVVVNLFTGNNFAGMGASGCTYGLIATMGLLFRGRRFFMFFIAVPSQYIVLILIVIGVITNLAQPINLVWISGALIAYLYVKLRWYLASQNRGSRQLSKQKLHRNFVDID